MGRIKKKRVRKNKKISLFEKARQETDGLFCGNQIPRIVMPDKRYAEGIAC